MPESEVPRQQEIHGVSTQNHSQAFVGNARDVYFAASHDPQEAAAQAAVSCRNALFLSDPYVDRESVISAKGTRAAGTCEWITRNAEYCAWLNGSNHENKRLLWISGGPGKGKTMLSIFLTEELERCAGSAKNTDLVFFFCSAEDDKRNTSVAVLRGIIHQILTKRPHLAKHVLSYFEPSERAQQTVSSLETLWLMFSKLVNDEELGTILCVLDGLDECEEGTLKVLLPRIIKLLSGDNLSSAKGMFKLVIVSRDVPGLQDCARVRLDPDNDENVASDIESFVFSRVAELSGIEGFNDEFRRFTQKALLARAEGTFLWVGFAMHELSQKKTCTEIWEALTDLPSGLPAIYSRMLLQIPAKKRGISQKILCWVAMAFRPLELQELAAAVGVQGASPHITIEQAVHDAVIRCGPLLKIQKRNVSLVHQSVRDYLLRKDDNTNTVLEAFRFETESAHLELARECLSCISKSGLQHRPIYFRKDLDNEQSPMLQYAITHWPEHAKSCSTLATELFDPFGFFLQQKCFLRSHWWSSYVFLTDRANFVMIPPPPLHMACALEIMPWAEALLAKDRWWPAYYRHINRKDYRGKTALHWAAQISSEATVRFLIDNGADIKAKNHFGETALHMTVYNTKEGVIQLLVERGADINAKDKYRKTALGYAVRHGFETEVRLLLEKRANVEERDNQGNTLLHWAVETGNEAVVQLLVERGLDVNAKQKQGETVLHWAVRAGNKAIVQLVIDRGADIEAEDIHGWRALHLAVRVEDKEIVQLLIDRGADIEAKDFNGRRPLHWACEFGEAEVALLLRARGADRMALDNQGRKPARTIY